MDRVMGGDTRAFLYSRSPDPEWSSDHVLHSSGISWGRFRNAWSSMFLKADVQPASTGSRYGRLMPVSGPFEAPQSDKTATPPRSWQQTVPWMEGSPKRRLWKGKSRRAGSRLSFMTRSRPSRYEDRDPSGGCSSLPCGCRGCMLWRKATKG